VLWLTPVSPLSQSYEHYERVKREREQQGLPPPPPPTNGARPSYHQLLLFRPPFSQEDCSSVADRITSRAHASCSSYASHPRVPAINLPRRELCACEHECSCRS